ncbi:late embryogenesis abundant protein [Striga asiatica]|uniref:Late embryogenesis abundant protein n=1 Tax=Striga asiatica TaxID=4170 RepID=A0A5A7RAS0_STRAF|nr:late embryogenesis abundant protein [Striga asiatica]
MADPLPPPPPATHTVHLPPEQIPRYPPEIAKRMAALTRIQEQATTMTPETLSRRRRRSFCCLLALSLVSLAAVLSASTAAAMYLAFDFKSPEYTVLALAIRGLNNLTSTSEPISPEITVSIRAENPNGRVGIYYLDDGAAGVSCGGVELSGGRMAAFYQPRRSVAVVRVTLAGSGVELGGGNAAFLAALRSAERRQRVPLVVKVEEGVVFEVGSAKTWKMVIKLRCHVVVDALTEKAEIVDKKCGHAVRLW